MAPTLDISRHRPAVIAVTSFAAVASIWAIYTAYSNRPAQTELRRSNAVRRTGANRSRIQNGAHPENQTHEESGTTAIDGGYHIDAERADTESPATRGRQNGEDRSQGLKKLLYSIAEEEAKRKAYEHRGIACEECGTMPIQGIRYHCLNCPDFDLCSVCEAHTSHIPTHVFAKIKIPLPILSQPMKEHPVWYPGDPRKVHSAGPGYSDLQESFQTSYGFEKPQIDALFDQFCSAANVPWPDDPNGIRAAIDRRAFNKAFTRDRWSQTYSPNTLYDAMFAFYDTNKDGIIGFKEFVSAISYLRGPKRYDTLRRALEGYDIDQDGYVNREDFMRLYRAKFEIQMGFVNDMVECYENDQTVSAMDHLRSSQPISAIFMQEDIPQGEVRHQAGKRMDQYGDMIPLNNTSTILEDDKAWPTQDNLPHEKLMRSLSRLDDVLNGELEMQNGNDRIQDPDVSSFSNQDFIDLGLKEDDSKGQTSDRPVDFDVYWYIVEESLNELLDPLFREREIIDAGVEESKEERRRWRADIDRHVQEVEAARREMQEGAMFDPLMAIAFDSKIDVQRKPHEAAQNETAPSQKAELSGAMIPTDEDTLTKNIEEIKSQSLEDLLASAGYAMSESGQEGDRTSEQSRDAIGERHGALSSDREVMLPEVSGFDPTMPQHKPDAANTNNNKDQIDKENQGARSAVPSRERLSYLAWHDEEERLAKTRGGIGRLSIDEIEQMCKMNRTRERRGLVLGWLEWASF